MATKVQIPRRRFTVDEYYRMAAAGILHEDDRVELIEGEITEMSPIGSRHAASVMRLTQHFSEQVGRTAIVDVQNPVRLSERSELQPDVSLLRPRRDFYAGGHPGPADVLLLIEVADTSADYDRQVKAPLYARAGIGEVWLVDLQARTIEVYRNPSPQGYRLVRIVHPEESLSPELLPDVALAAGDILGS